MIRKISITLVALLSLSSIAFADDLEPDVEGCKDSKLLTRMAGCNIAACDKKEFDSMELNVGSLEEGQGDFKKKSFEGKTESLTYVCPQGKYSGLQIVRNAEGALKKAGFTPVWSGKGGNNGPETTMKKDGQWVYVGTSSTGGDGTWYEIKAVQVQKMDQQMEATADSLAEEIAKSGHVAVYGINFDSGKATLKPDSDKILGQVAMLLKNDEALKLKVEGHTDNVGAKVANQKLSEQRAAAVVAWLVKNGIAKTRLTSAGFGDAKPVAANDTDENKAKNRRVELVKQ